MSLQNPKVIEFSKRGSSGFVTPDEMREMLAEAKFDGHDGAIIKHWQDGSGDTQYVAFRPEQIKSSIGNNGNFDRNDPNVCHSRMTATVPTAAELMGPLSAYDDGPEADEEHCARPRVRG